MNSISNYSQPMFLVGNEKRRILNYSQSAFSVVDEKPLSESVPRKTSTSNYNSLFDAFYAYKVGNITDSEINDYVKQQLYVIKKFEIFPVDEDEMRTKNDGRVSVYSVSTAEQMEKDFSFLVCSETTVFNFDKDGNVILPTPRPVMPNKLLTSHNALISDNEILLGEGSKIELYGGYSAHVYEGSVRYCYNDRIISSSDLLGGEHSAFFDKIKGFASFVDLLRHHANGDISSSYIGSISELRSNTSKFLSYMGINKNESFLINGVKFKYYPDDSGGGILRTK